MKIIILVLSFDQPPYDALMEAQKQTWDSIHVDGVDTIYYMGNSPESFSLDTTVHFWGSDLSKTLQLPCTDSYYFMADKFQRCLNYIQDNDYDIIFRTNSSSYVNKEKLMRFAESLPKEKLYAGWELIGNAGYNVVSGAGMFLSKDVSEILRKNIDPAFEKEEDVYIGQILSQHGIEIINDKSRIDWPEQVYQDPSWAYHIRFKTSDRIKDAENMRAVHKLIIQ